MYLYEEFIPTYRKGTVGTQVGYRCTRMVLSITEYVGTVRILNNG